MKTDLRRWGNIDEKWSRPRVVNPAEFREENWKENQTEEMGAIKGAPFSGQWPTKMAHRGNHFKATLSIPLQ